MIGKAVRHCIGLHSWACAAARAPSSGMPNGRPSALPYHSLVLVPAALLHALGSPLHKSWALGDPMTSSSDI